MYITNNIFTNNDLFNYDDTYLYDIFNHDINNINDLKIKKHINIVKLYNDKETFENINNFRNYKIIYDNTNKLYIVYIFLILILVFIFFVFFSM